MQCRFEVGQRVVLIDDEWLMHDNYPNPSLGDICTILFIDVSPPSFDPDGERHVWLEIVGYYPYYHHTHFRPLDERDISIEQFERLLVDLPERVREMV